MRWSDVNTRHGRSPMSRYRSTIICALSWLWASVPPDIAYTTPSTHGTDDQRHHAAVVRLYATMALYVDGHTVGPRPLRAPR